MNSEQWMVNGEWLCLALENIQSELFDMKTKYDEATSAKYVRFDIFQLISLKT